MEFTHEHEELRRNLKRFIDNEINPHVDEWEEAEIFPAKALFKQMGALGFLGLTKPEEYGGSALDWSYAMVMAETLGHIRCGGVPMAIGVQTDMATPALARFGSDEVKKEFLAPSVSGEYVACLGVSEPGAGSDVASIKTSAKKDGGDYVINGGKLWTTSGTQADWMCLLANTSEGAAHKNKTLICLPMKTKGVSVAKKLRKIGMMSSDTAQIHLSDAPVPGRAPLGRVGEDHGSAALYRRNRGLHARAQDVRRHGARIPVGAIPACRAADRGRGAARARLPRSQPAHQG